MNETARKQQILDSALNYMAAAFGKPLLYDAAGKPLAPTASLAYRRSAAKKSGSMKNWIPKRFLSDIEEATERESIVERSIDLVNNDPHAAGVADSFATTIVGSGLTPHPALNPDVLNLEKSEIRRLQAQQRAAYLTWSAYADAAERMNFGAIQYLVQRNLMQYGEYLVLLPMIQNPARPYSLACQIISPLRLKTPSDKTTDKNIKDGVEVGEYGEPVAYWIQKSERETGKSSAQMYTSVYFTRIPVKKGHRWNVLHGFVQQDADQYRGMPFFAPAMKFFRDLNDYLDAELVSNIVTAAFALFIEQPGSIEPFWAADNLQSLSGSTVSNTNTPRYQEVMPGQIMYGNVGEKPSVIAASRPGVTFEPFTKTIKKAIAMAMNIPYPVLFKDAEQVNFAGFRSAMLDAWRVFMQRRVWLGQGFCQKVYTMLQEEAYLRGRLDAKDFYTNMHLLTNAEWRGAPKGDIEPIKAVQADVIAIQNNLKTRAEAIAERGGDIRTTFDQLQEEQEMMAERGLNEKPIDGTPANEPEGVVDDMEGAGENVNTE